MKNSLHAGDRHCLVGWLMLVHSTWDQHVRNIRNVGKAIEVLYPERVGVTGKAFLAGFNDHPETTFEDVLRVLKVADV